MPYFVTVTLLWKELACGDYVTFGGDKENKGYSDDKNGISDMEVASW
jgi:hypothetical protein